MANVSDTKITAGIRFHSNSGVEVRRFANLER